MRSLFFATVFFALGHGAQAAGTMAQEGLGDNVDGNGASVDAIPHAVPQNGNAKISDATAAYCPELTCPKSGCCTYAYPLCCYGFCCPRNYPYCGRDGRCYEQ